LSPPDPWIQAGRVTADVVLWLTKRGAVSFDRRRDLRLYPATSFDPRFLDAATSCARGYRSRRCSDRAPRRSTGRGRRSGPCRHQSERRDKADETLIRSARNDAVMMKSCRALLIGGVVLAGAACSNDASFRAHGISFEYPGDWKRMVSATSNIAQASPRWTAAVGVNGNNLVSIDAYHLAFPVTETNFEQFADELTNRVTKAARDANGRLVGDAETTTLGGLPGFRFRIAGDKRENRVVIAFDGTIELLLECRSTEEFREEIGEGCEQILTSFERIGS
jgi:hypothetical protein